MDFTGFLGNDAIKRRLSGAFASGRVAHSYLLCGPAGSGKHTLARILCAAMECAKDGAPALDEAEQKLVQTVAGFLGRQMES